MAKFFEKLFKNRTPETETTQTSTGTAMVQVMDDVTKPLEPISALSLNAEGTTEPPQLAAGCAQSVGRQRDHNEDALFTLTTCMANNSGNLSFGLYIVADGMGGHQHGEIASETATRAMAEHIIRQLYAPLFSVSPLPPEESLQEIMQAGVNKAHEAITKSITGGGTTMTAVLILGKQMIIAHVGDSRIYAVNPNGTMKALTRDHSLVKRLEELGQLTPEEAAIHPQRNVLYRALGQGEPFEPEIILGPLPSPGYLLICSDGLWGLVSEIHMGDIIIDAETPQKACQDLIAAANGAGGPDNITAILVHLPG